MAVLSLWIAKRQMNREFLEQFGVDIPLIPLKESGNILAANATLVNWQEHCPNDGAEEIYLIGNPPYKGSSGRDPHMAAYFKTVFKDRSFSAKLDHVALWFVEGADYIRGTQAQLVFVSTNSVVQGEHVSLMFPTLLMGGIEIGYAYTSFRWENNAKYNAGVSVVVISLRNRSSAKKYIYDGEHHYEAKNINGYLFDAQDIIVSIRKRPISKDFLPMLKGNQPTDGGNLILSPSEKDLLVKEYPESIKSIRKICGANDYINGVDRFCLFILEDMLDQAERMPGFEQRMRKIKQMRLASRDSGTRKLAEAPWRFREQRIGNSIIVPSVSSERREYTDRLPWCGYRNI